MTIALYAEFSATAGNLALDPHHLADSPTTVFVFETYRDQAAFDEHLASFHRRDFNQRLGTLKVGGASRPTMLSPIVIGTAVESRSHGLLQ